MISVDYNYHYVTQHGLLGDLINHPSKKKVTFCSNLILIIPS